MMGGAMRRWFLACASVLAVPALALTLSLVSASAASPATSTSPSPLGATSPGPGATPSAESQSTGTALPGDPTNGAQLFGQTCASCHGADLTGGVGPRLNPIERCGNTKDPLAVPYLTQVVTDGLQGVTCTSAQSKQMPAKGGNSSLTDKDVADIVSYIIQENTKPGLPPLDPRALAVENVKWVTIGILAMLVLTWMLARYNMRWIARRAAARRERLERQGRG